VFDVSPTELIFILLVALLVFGPRQLPDMARKVARFVREIQKTAGELQRSLTKEVDELKKPLTDLKAPLDEIGDLDARTTRPEPEETPPPEDES
jgi:Tat protein translocase TatB subunit